MSLLSKPSLMKNSVREGFIAARIFRGFAPEGYSTKQYIENSSPGEVISHLERYIKSYPKQWLAYYLLGDWYTRDKRYIDALNILKRAYELKPQDPRSSFALATTFRILARARFVDMEMEFDYQAASSFTNENKMSMEDFLQGQRDFDSGASSDELEKLGLTIDEVALKAIEYFERTLLVGVRSNEKKFVISFLQHMYADFPHLEVKSKNIRSTNTGLFGTARKGSAGILNEAIDKYSRLRILIDQPGRYRYELAETIRLCQWAIASDEQLGDPYVLLANCYSLLDSQISSLNDPNFYKKWAVIILYHWMNSPLNNFPFTKSNNVEIGHQLYSGLLMELSKLYGLSIQEVENQIRLDSLPEILSPSTYERIKDQLINEPLP